MLVYIHCALVRQPAALHLHRLCCSKRGLSLLVYIRCALVRQSVSLHLQR